MHCKPEFHSLLTGNILYLTRLHKYLLAEVSLFFFFFYFFPFCSVLQQYLVSPQTTHFLNSSESINCNITKSPSAAPNLMTGWKWQRAVNGFFCPFWSFQLHSLPRHFKWIDKQALKNFLFTQGVQCGSPCQRNSNYFHISYISRYTNIFFFFFF